MDPGSLVSIAPVAAKPHGIDRGGAQMMRIDGAANWRRMNYAGVLENEPDDVIVIYCYRHV